MTGPHKSSDYLHQGRQDRLLREGVHDPYQSKSKLPEPTVCPGCGAVFHRGHWTWSERPEGAHETLCPACHRIHDEVPAGLLTLSGAFFDAHRDELMRLVQHVEQREKTAHPLKRIMSVEDRNGTRVITLTDPHLARGIGEALHHAYQGDLEYAYGDEDILLRVGWSR